MEGWIKLHRKIVEWKFFKNSEVYHVFSTLVLLANHKDGFTKDGTKVLSGQLMTSRKSISKITGIDESKVFRIMKKLEIEQQIKQHTSSKNSIISIVNYHDYQIGEQVIEQQVNSERTASEQQVNTNKNANNNNNGNNIIITASPISFLFNHRPDIQEWLNHGNHDTHLILLKENSHHVLVEQIPNLFTWSQSKGGVRAESWMRTKLLNTETKVYGANQAQKSFSRKGHGVASSPENPTGNPYIQEAIDKGLVG